MIYEIGNRSVVGIAFAGILTFIALTIMKVISVEVSVDELWLNMLGSILIGIHFSVASFIFDHEKWSFLKQIIIHFSISLLVFFPIAIFLTGWIPAKFMAIMIGLGIFVLTYLMFMSGIYIYLRKQTEALNTSVKRK